MDWTKDSTICWTSWRTKKGLFRGGDGVTGKSRMVEGDFVAIKVDT